MSSISNFYRKCICILDCGAPIADLAIRIWLANVFFKAGLAKISNWKSTIWLFENEYSVPVLSAEFAAYLGTATELIFPVLLAFGLASRAAAGILFLFNIVAVISYPALDANSILWHQVWGIMLLVPLLRGPGKISIDHFISNRWMSSKG